MTCAVVLLASAVTLVRAQGVPPTVAPWADDFDDTSKYTPGQDPTLPSVGGWEPFGLAHLPGTTIDASRFLSAPHSLKNAGDSDVVQKLTGTAGSAWRMEASTYIPGPGQPDESGTESWFILMSVYNPPAAAPKKWSLQLGFDPVTSQVRYLGGTNNGLSFPFPKDKWVRVLVDVDFSQPPGSLNAQAYYDIGAGPVTLGPPFDWSEGASQGGNDEIHALDLFSGNQIAWGSKPNGAAYYDDLRLYERAPNSFCTAKTALVCGTPSIGSTGQASATATSGFAVSAVPARTNRAGILLYNTATLASGLPFQGGTLCIDPQGLRRAGPTNSRGSCNPNFCTGAFVIDMNTFAHGLWVVPDCAGNPAGIPGHQPAAYLTQMGTRVHAQFWGRDTVITGSFVSDARGWIVGP